MKFRPRIPRVLPLTIVALAAVLTARSIGLVRAAIENGQPMAFFAAAFAAGTDAPAAKQPAPAPGDASQVMKPDRDGGTGKPPPASPDQASEARTVPTGPPPMTDGEKAVLLDLRQRRQELEAREASLADRESMLAAAEKKLTERVAELRDLQTRLEGLEANRKRQEDSAWQGLVKVYEDMKPRDAAAIFNDLGMPVLLAVVDRMKENKAAAILAAMTPDKARDLTTQLARLRTKGAGTLDTSPEAPPMPPPGGPRPSGT